MSKTELNYYDLLQADVAEKIAPLSKIWTDLKEHVANLKRGIEKETASAASLNAQRDALLAEIKQAADLRIMKDKLSKQDHIEGKLAAAERGIRTLKENVLPGKEQQAAEAGRNLEHAILTLMRSKRNIADQRFNDLLLKAFEERDQYTAAFQRIAAEHGRTLLISDEGLLPGIMNTNDIRSIRHRFAEQRGWDIINESLRKNTENEVSNGG